MGGDNEWEEVEVGTASDRREVYHEGIRHLDYNSTYLDYMALGISDRSVVGTNVPADPSVSDSVDTERGGILGTISTLWTSTFSRTT